MSPLVMKKIRKILLTVAITGSMLMGAVGAQAVSMTYDFTITGTVTLGDEILVPNAFDLTAGETITATGTFTADLSGAAGSESGVVSFHQSSGNSLTIDIDGGMGSAFAYTEADDTGFLTGLGPTIEFRPDNELGFSVFVDFDSKLGIEEFNSLGNTFDDQGGLSGLLIGQWELTNLTPVPVPAAAWLFGSALLGLMSLRRRK